MEIDQVAAFLAIVRSRGFSSATAALHVSQPAVSRRVERLETELGARLFERLPRGVRLTDAGSAFLPHAEALLAAVEDGIGAVRELKRRPAGPLAVALVGTLASTSLTGTLKRFREALPLVDLRLRTALSAEVSALVRRGEVALGLRYGVDPGDDLVSAVLFEEPLVAVCPPRHRLARRRSGVDPRALEGETWVGFPPRPDAPEEPYALALRRHLASRGMGDARIVPIDSLTAQKRMVEAGFGLALLPASSVGEEIRAGSLRVLRLSGPRASVPVTLIRRRGGHLGEAARRLTELLSSRHPRSESGSVSTKARISSRTRR